MRYKEWILYSIFYLLLFGSTNLLGQQTLNITSVGDHPSTIGELRWAINQANSYAGTTTIRFNLPSNGTNPVIINLGSALPIIRKTIIIDGTTQAGYQTGKPIVVIDGIAFTTQSSGFQLYGVTNAKISGLCIRNFYNAIVLDSSATCSVINNVINQNVISNVTLYRSAYCVIKGNYINTDFALTHFSKNSEEGIFFTNKNLIGSSNNTIGGIECGEGNIIAYTISEGIDNSPNLGSNPSLNKNNMYSGNVIFNNNFDAIELRNSSNGNKSMPVITSTGCITKGTAGPNDRIELFGSSGLVGSVKNANQYMKSVVADASGNWTANFDFIEYPFITATARNALNNTSELCPAKSIMPSIINFSFPTELCVGSPITFTNLSTSCTGNITFKWDFGDGSALSTNSIHTYTVPGTYNITLYVYPSIYCKSYSFTKTILITNCCPSCQKLNFGSPDSICKNQPILFVNTSTQCDASISFIWDFGDGSSPSTNATHTYSSIGTYYVILYTIAVNNCVSQTFRKQITVSDCNRACIDCIGSFAPESGTYILSAWVKEENAVPTILTYTNPQIYIQFPTDPGFGGFSSPALGPFTAKGAIIDGWQRIEAEFYIPANATYINLQLKTLSVNCFYDDIRIFPVNGSMKSYVYDPVTLRLVAELDERNYATMYEYDEEGKLVRVKKETEKGIMTIKTNSSNTKKKQ